MLRFIKGKCQSGIKKCQRPARFNLYHTLKGVKTWKNVCDRCVLIIEEDNERLWSLEARGRSIWKDTLPWGKLSAWQNTGRGRNMITCESCGKHQAMHFGTKALCCWCHIASDGIPSDWHTACMTQ